jgi:hypothetical protein
MSELSDVIYCVMLVHKWRPKSHASLEIAVGSVREVMITGFGDKTKSP